MKPNFQLYGLVVEATMRILYCANFSTFQAIFGREQAEHLWAKFIQFDRSEGRFLCALDTRNLARIARYAYITQIPAKVQHVSSLVEALDDLKDALTIVKKPDKE